MTRKKIVTEWPWEQDFLKEILSSQDFRIKSAWSGTKIYLPNKSDINVDKVEREIEYLYTDKLNHIVFVADLEHMNIDVLKKNLILRKSELEKKHKWITVDFFIEVRQLEAWLISDIEWLKSFLGNHSKIPYSKIRNPTDGIHDPYGVISELFTKAGKQYKKRTYESRIWKLFNPSRSISDSFKFFFSSINNN